ncbi:hypothetical protein [Phenylobacterium sp.]|uniref:hypothetical protein n=1 Tax=Phenylobacterium sp. TaxID=1871053 RepID=UPI0025D48674|nr:hypothetical protein [Phenylobacterium sp.]
MGEGDITDGSGREETVAPVFMIAPPFRPRLDLPFAMLVSVLLAATPWATLLNVPYGWVVTYILPWVFLIGFAVRGSSVDEFHEKAYVDNLLTRNAVQDTTENREAAQKEFKKYKDMSNAAGGLMICLWIYLSICHLVIFIGKNKPGTFFDEALDWARFIGFMLVMFFWSASTAGAEKRQRNIGDLFDGQRERLDLAEHETNDLEVGRLKISMQVMIRRVEAYTIESTLLSGLSLSVFVAICFSDTSAIDFNKWMESVAQYCLAETKFCVPAINLNDTKEHYMYVICFFMLLCSTFFMAVLVTRLRFGDGAKDIEEMLEALNLLNQIENASQGDQRGRYTREITSILSRARVGLDSLRPTLDFMKLFRALGILSFVAASALCGLMFSPVVAAVVIFVFVLAFLFSFADQVRHNISVVRLVESTVLGRLRVRPANG